MKVSYNFLKQLVGFKKSPKEIAELINLHITEVEEVSSSSQYQGVVVGEIVEINLHPDADKLQLTKVNVGDKTLDIVCGANNIEVGQKVPVALIGCSLPGGLEISSAIIRGQRSFGMLCSKAELNLAKDPLTDGEGIWILDEKLKIGTPLSEVIGENSDTVFDLKVLANRPDYLAYLSIAREIAAVLKHDFKPDIKYDLTESHDKTTDAISIEVRDYILCPRYIGRVIKNITVKQSPVWMQQVLLSSGLRPINNIVDISNYVSLELGQPTHSFDLSKIEGSQIIVRLSADGEKLRGLDGSQHDLDNQTLVIADNTKPLAIGGIVGGEESSVVDSTADILLEVANFDMVSIRKTSRRLGIRTDSSARFERGLSVLLPERAMKRVIHLIQQECPECQVLQGVVDVYKKLPPPTTEMRVDVASINRLIGIEIDPSEMADILTRLDLSTEVAGSNLVVQVSDYRSDITHPADVVEEILRMYGTDKVPTAMPEIVVRPIEMSRVRLNIGRIKNILARMGFWEIYLPPFDSGGSKTAIALENPLINVSSHLKTDLVHGLNRIALLESGYRTTTFKVFELNTAFVGIGEVLPNEFQQLAGRVKDKDAYRIARGVVDDLLRELGARADYVEVPKINGIRILVDKKPIGEIVQTSPDDAYFGLDITSLSVSIKRVRLFEDWSKFPPIKFDMAFVVPHRIRIGELIASIYSADPLVDRVELFDVFDLGDEGKNLAFHITLRHPHKTLTSKDRELVTERIKKQLQERHKAKLREA